MDWNVVTFLNMVSYYKDKQEYQQEINERNSKLKRY